MRALAILAALGLFGCGQPNGGVGDTGDPVAEPVLASGKLSRLAVSGRDGFTELPLVRNCASATGAESGVVAPPCRSVPDPGRLPAIVPTSGQNLTIVTGQGAATVTLVGADKRQHLDAEPLDKDRQSWSLRVPEAIERGRPVEISVSPLRTDSGSLGFGLVVSRP